ncbi:MAG: molybdopterin-dependent oxidoreductase [Candidatus Dadabacteria bacterium]|nr:molybdopterin-dependent oxidoreductase [Candidatus Dadabacteria bacterium]
MSRKENKANNGMKRRDFLKVLGVAGGTAAVAGSCSEPVEQLIPYVIPPENFIPGVPKFYSTTCRECSSGCGLVVKNREGRAIKVEGSPESPVNRGKTCAVGQASLQGLYNPDRVRSPLRKNAETRRLEPIGWKRGEEILAEKLNSRSSGKVVYLSNNVSGTYSKFVAEFLKPLGGEHYVYETFSHEPIRKANSIVFGRDEIPSYRIDKANYLLSFGADYLETWLSSVSNSIGYSELRNIDHGKTGKVVHVEPRCGMTASNADTWISAKPGTEQYVALGIANSMISKGFNKVAPGPIAAMVSRYSPKKVAELTDVPADTIEKIARDFATSRSLAIGGGAANTGSNATETMVAVNILNYLAGNIGRTVDFSDPLSISDASTFSEIERLVEEMRSGRVEVLILHNVNPVFTLPGELKISEALEKVPFVVSLSSFLDETSDKAHLILPESTSFESWGDYSPKKSVTGIIQPVMRPVFNTKSPGDALISVSKNVEALKNTFDSKKYYDYLRNSWKNRAAVLSPGTSFEKFWENLVVKGSVTTIPAPVNVALSSSISSISFSEPQFRGEGDFHLIAYPSYRFLDGRGANKPWLQELPDALTTSVWDSWLEINPSVAAKMGLEDGSYVKVDTPGGSFEVQVFVYEGIRPDTVAVPLGQGHTSYGRYAKGRGVNPFALLPAATDALSGGLSLLSTKVSVSSLRKRDLLVRTQYTKTQGDRHVAKTVALDQIGHHNGHHGSEHSEHPDFYPDLKYAKYRWGMAIDLNKCTGCGACVTACYAENNIPFVGKKQVAKRREMNWIRIERFFEKNSDGSLDVRFLPMLCQQCGNAPCEPVCPVFATYHNHEGLNGMIYNRCVGTRYCANNCTYKVRRFNWYTYKFPEPLNWQLNPDVTVRSSGIMEKCTFCVQRISHGKDLAKDEGRLLRDREVLTACEQACPSDAIVFGNLLDEKSRASVLSGDERGYKVLEVVNTKPEITYLKKVKQERV